MILFEATTSEVSRVRDCIDGVKNKILTCAFFVIHRLSPFILLEGPAKAPEKISSALGLRSMLSPTDTERPGWKREVWRELGMAEDEFRKRKEGLLFSESAKEVPPCSDSSEFEDRERCRELEAFEGGGSCMFAAAEFEFVAAVVLCFLIAEEAAAAAAA